MFFFRISQGPPNAPDFKIHKAMERILKARGDMLTTRYQNDVI